MESDLRLAFSGGGKFGETRVLRLRIYVLGEFANVARQPFSPDEIHRVGGEQFAIVVSDHGNAGAGRQDNGFVSVVLTEKTSGERPRFIPITGIEGRLPTAGLRGVEDALDDEGAKRVDDGFSDFREN